MFLLVGLEAAVVPDLGLTTSVVLLAEVVVTLLSLLLLPQWAKKSWLRVRLCPATA
jgi:hypothetical protein